jgi:hypothetical protein
MDQVEEEEMGIRGFLGRAGLSVGVVGAVLVALCAGAARGAGATNVPCSGTGGGGPGLAAAIAAANADGGGNVNLAQGCTYTLTTTTATPAGPAGLVVTASIKLNGPGATIEGNGTFRILAINGPAGGSLSLNGITVTDGNASGQGPAGFGGGILNFGGSLSLNNSVVTANTAAGAGGGIANVTMGPGPQATLNLNNSEVSWNTAPGGMGAGGILDLAGVLTINNSTIDNNSSTGGGGISAGNGNGGGAGSSVTINNSLFSDNTATDEQAGGGGISNGGSLSVNNSQFSGNSSAGFGGGILNHGFASLNNIQVSGNTAAFGGGVANASLVGIPVPGATPPVPTLSINNGTITGNTAFVPDGGGGIINASVFGGTLGTVTLHNTDVIGNTPNNCSPDGSIAGCTG